MISSENDRQKLRKEMGKRRDSLSRAEVESFSGLITSKMVELRPLQDARTIMLYASIANEVQLNHYLDGQEVRGKSIYLPRVESNGELSAVEFKGWQATRPGAFGIPEPIGVASSPQEIDAVVVPGLVFDAHGYRLGYGKGYYDRFLKCLAKNTFICGVCYEFQVVDSISPHAGDQPVHWIVTERSELVINWDFF